jgi:RNA-directed DNA polymerase
VTATAYLLKFAWTRIVRHQMVPGTASPDDPTLTDYGAQRRRRSTPPLDGISLRLLRAQHGRCPACGGLLLHAEHEPTTLPEWEQWLTVTRKAVRKKVITTQGVTPGTPDGPVAIQLIHAHCQQRRTAIAVSLAGTLLQPMTQEGPLEPGAVKAARRVLRGPRRSNAPGLPDGTG